MLAVTPHGSVMVPVLLGEYTEDTFFAFTDWKENGKLISKKGRELY